MNLHFTFAGNRRVSAWSVLFSILVVTMIMTLGACANPFGMWSFDRTFDTQSQDGGTSDDPPQAEPPVDPPVDPPVALPETNGLDIFFTNADGDHEVYLADPLGGYSARSLADPGCMSFRRGALLGHFNGDGFPDALVLCGVDVHRIFPGDGTGNFGVPTTLAPHSLVAYDAVFVDLNGVDGDDLVIAYNGANRIRFDVAGGFGTSQSLGTVEETRSIVAADFDLDGDTDLFAANRGGHPCMLSTNVSPGAWTNHMYGVAIQSSDAAVGDFDGDGIPDVLVTVYGGSNVIYWSDGSDAFEKVDNISPHTDDSQALAVGDFNGDGHLDAYVANVGTLDILYLGDGQGSFPSFMPVADSLVDPSDVAAADMNGDGHLDVVVASFGGRNRIYYGDGNGSFPQWFELSEVELGSVAVAIGDIGAE
jgi:hypothetical protein